ncbi:MAG: Imm39 family immunity protein [Methylotenera sp.]
MAHNRKLVLSGISLTKARPNRHGIEVAGKIRDELEGLLIASGYFDNAPFKWVGLSLRYGLKYENQPHYQHIDKHDGELPLAIELDTHELIEADRAELKKLFMHATLKALVHAGRKYNLPIKSLEELARQFCR